MRRLAVYLRHYSALIVVLFLLSSCSSAQYAATSKPLDLEKFMGRWYVIAFRPIFLEKKAHNAIEEYRYNKDTEEIEVVYTFRKGSFDAELSRYTQRGVVLNKETNAHWSVSPMWPFWFDYLVLSRDDAYQWAVIGVPSGRYLWLLAREPHMSKTEVDNILNDISSSGYPIENYSLVPQKYN